MIRHLFATILVLASVGGSFASAATLKELLRDAHRGDAVAMRKVGYNQFAGRGGFKQHRRNGFAWLKLAAEKGDTQALYYLGCIYQRGTYVGMDLKEAERYFSQAAARGHENAKKKLEELRSKPEEETRLADKKTPRKKEIATKKQEEKKPEPEEETDKKQDNSKSRLACEDLEIQESDDPDSQAEQYYEAGCKYEKQGNDRLAIENYLKAAKLGHAESIYKIGRTCFFDIGDLEKGISAFVAACKKDHEKAAFAMGQIYCSKHIPVGLIMEDEDEFGFALIMFEDKVLRIKYDDMERGIVFLRAAATSGVAGAQALLGFFCEQGEGVAKDVKQAKEWYQKAADQGCKFAAEKLKEL